MTDLHRLSSGADRHLAKALRHLRRRYRDSEAGYRRIAFTTDEMGAHAAARLSRLGSQIRRRPLAAVAIMAASALALGTLTYFSRHRRSPRNPRRLARRRK